MSVREVARMTGMDPWFLYQMKQITRAQKIGEKPMER
jgi:carbamoyl-phosphate synthase large subunit